MVEVSLMARRVGRPRSYKSLEDLNVEETIGDLDHDEGDGDSAEIVIRKKDVAEATARLLDRLVRCHPERWNHPGFDDVSIVPKKGPRND